MSEAEQIKLTFLDAICSARANPPHFTMSESCHRSCYEIGINSAAVQHEIGMYFKREAEAFQKLNQLPNYFDTQGFLIEMSFKYAGCSMAVNPQKALLDLRQKESELHDGIINAQEGKSERYKVRARRNSNENNKNRELVRTRSGKNPSNRLPRGRLSRQKRAEQPRNDLVVKPESKPIIDFIEGKPPYDLRSTQKV